MNAHVKVVISPAQQLLTMTLGIVQTQLLNVAAQLKLADRLKDGPQSAVELAEATGMDPATLTRLMASLAHIGVFAETAPGLFSCTPIGVLLQTDALHSMRDVALTYGGVGVTNAWPRLLERVRTGASVFWSLLRPNASPNFRTKSTARS